jgi:hypothetical protein
VALQQTTRVAVGITRPVRIIHSTQSTPAKCTRRLHQRSNLERPIVTPNRYYAQSSAPEESGIPVWYPVEFNPEHICWVEVRWAEPAGSEGYWQAFRIAGEDLGLDITQEEVEGHIERTSGINNYQGINSKLTHNPRQHPIRT